MLDQNQIDRFHENGYLLVEDVVTGSQLSSLRRDFECWVEESRQHSEPYGTTQDGRPRFDLEPGHSADKPALRRVSSPIELSDAYYEAVTNSQIPDAIADLIGPNIKFHHCKINSKLPGAKTEVKFHQDFLFTPHSNDDLITALLFLDDVTLSNGPLEVVPGSHKGPLHRLWHEGVFTGAIDENLVPSVSGATTSCTGPSGSVCFMHTRLLHGSAPNQSDMPRTLFITVYSAEDAIPLATSPLPNRFEGEIIRGEQSHTLRCTPFEIELPQPPQGASFFTQQAGSGK